MVWPARPHRRAATRLWSSFPPSPCVTPLETCGRVIDQLAMVGMISAMKWYWVRPADIADAARQRCGAGHGAAAVNLLLYHLSGVLLACAHPVV